MCFGVPMPQCSVKIGCQNAASRGVQFKRKLDSAAFSRECLLLGEKIGIQASMPGESSRDINLKLEIHLSEWLLDRIVGLFTWEWISGHHTHLCSIGAPILSTFLCIKYALEICKITNWFLISLSLKVDGFSTTYRHNIVVRSNYSYRRLIVVNKLPPLALPLPPINSLPLSVPPSSSSLD